MARKPFDPATARGGLFPEEPIAARPTEPRPVSVAELAAAVNGAALGLGRVRVEGEIGAVSAKRACYFSLKDPEADALVECMMWLNTMQRSPAQPEQGKRMVVEGRVEFYAPHGRLRLNADRVSLVGEGDLEARFRALCDELRRLGYFAEERKRPLPAIPRGVAIVTASGSAALADCLKISGERFPSVPIRVVHVAVQGAGAAEQVARGIDLVNRHAQRLGVDVLVVTRGGGSREDLQAFNERIVAEAAFRSRLPLVAAIGHESDQSVIELVADVRASTPTQAMVEVLPDRSELRAQVDSVAARLAWQVQQGIRARRERLRSLASRACLRDPRALATLPARRLAEAMLRLRHALARAGAAARRRLIGLESALASHAPTQAVALGRGRTGDLARRLALAAGHTRRRHAEALRTLAARLEAVAPERTLARGYSITLDADGKVVRSAATLKDGARIETRLEQGTVRSRVERSG